MALPVVVAVDTGNAASTTPNLTINPSGTDRLLLAFLCFTDPAATVTSFDFKTTEAFTFVDSQVFAGQYTVWMYRLVAPTTGSGDIDVVISGTGSWAFGAISLTDVLQSTPLGTPVKATGTSTSPTVAVLSGFNDALVIGGLGYNEAKVTETFPGDQTEEWNVSHAFGPGANRPTSIGTTEEELTPDTANLDYTLSASRDWAMIGVEIRGNGAAPPISQNQVMSVG